MSYIPSALADLLRAFIRLQPEDDATRMEIAWLLGIELVEFPVTEQPDRKQPVRARNRTRNYPKTQRRNSLPARSTPPPAPLDKWAEREAVLTLEFAPSRRPLAWLEGLAPLTEGDATRIPAVPVPDPLFEPRWTRALLSESLSVREEIGPLDVARLVRGVAQGIPWRTVPRNPWPTLTRGVQVLVDRSEAMAPFAMDQYGLIERLHAVVGQQGLEVLRFDGCPSRGAGSGPRRIWRPYFDLPLRPGTTVLALTDLGIGDQGLATLQVSPEEWSSFAERLRRRGCALVAFVPYRSDRWPAGLERVMTILPWNRGTSVRTMQRVASRSVRRSRT